MEELTQIQITARYVRVVITSCSIHLERAVKNSHRVNMTHPRMYGSVVRRTIQLECIQQYTTTTADDGERVPTDVESEVY